MVLAIFAFGSDGGFHFECPSDWKNDKLPPEIKALFDQAKIGSVCCLALGDSGSFFITYKDREDGKRVRSIFKNLPPSLMDFLSQKSPTGLSDLQLDRMKLSLGPGNKSYWVTDGRKHQWMDLPQGLANEIEQLKLPTGVFSNNPRIVSLGVDDNWVLIKERGEASWNLSSYPQLDSLFRELAQAKIPPWPGIQTVYLNPHTADCAVVHGYRGFLAYFNIPDGEAATGFLSIEKSLEKDTQDEIVLQRRQAEMEMENLKHVRQTYTNAMSNMMAMNTATNINLINHMWW